MVLYVVPAFQVLPVTIFISEDATVGDCGSGVQLLGCSIVFWVPVVLFFVFCTWRIFVFIL